MKIGVMGKNAANKTEVVAYTVTCSEADVQSGAHYKMAEAQAKQAGIKPYVSFDEQYPAARSLIEITNYFLGGAFEARAREWFARSPGDSGPSF